MSNDLHVPLSYSLGPPNGPAEGTETDALHYGYTHLHRFDVDPRAVSMPDAMATIFLGAHGNISDSQRIPAIMQSQLDHLEPHQDRSHESNMLRWLAHMEAQTKTADLQAQPCISNQYLIGSAAGSMTIGLPVLTLHTTTSAGPVRQRSLAIAPKTTHLSPLSAAKRTVAHAFGTANSGPPKRRKQNYAVDSIIKEGFHTFAIDLPGRQTKRNSRHGRPRPASEQAARERGACIRCKAKKYPVGSTDDR